MRKITSLLLAFALCISCLGLTALAADGAAITAKYADGEITVKGTGFDSSQGVTISVADLMIPATTGSDGSLDKTFSTQGSPITATNVDDYTVEVLNKGFKTLAQAKLENDVPPTSLTLTVTMTGAEEGKDSIVVKAGDATITGTDGKYEIPYADIDKVMITVTSDKDVEFASEDATLVKNGKSASVNMTKAATVTVTLTAPKAIASIAVQAGFQDEYKVGEKFNPTGLMLIVTYNDNTTENVTYDDTTKADFTFEPDLETALKVGDKATVTYKGVSAEPYALTVVEVPAAPEFADDSWVLTAADATTAEFTLKTAAPAGAIYTVYTDEKCTTKAEGVTAAADGTKLTLSGVSMNDEIAIVAYYVTVKLAADGEESLGTLVAIYAYGTPSAPEFVNTTVTANSDNKTAVFTLKAALPEGATILTTDDEVKASVEGTKVTITFTNAISTQTQVGVCVKSGEKIGESTILTVNRYTSGGGGSSGGGGGGGGGGSSSTVTKSTTSNGSYTLSNSSAKAGDSVKITPKANSGYEVDQITVTDKKGNAVAVTKNSDGTYSFTMPASSLQPVKTSVTFKKTESTSGGTSGGTTGGGTSGGSTSTGFSDVPADAYYAAAVKWAVDNKITTGTSESTFSPNADCTRAQAVTFLYRAAGSPAVSGTNQFTDVNASDYFSNAVAWAVANGITNGTGEGTFAPNAICTRAEIVTFLARYEKANTTAGATAFSDVADNDWYAGAVSWAVANNITTGTSSNTFSPKDSCTRAQIVTFLYRDMVK